jgi:nitroimidazol reductase NimA-like FMN-containing flavoprotein (pyridoxamine 5'-phosphate oxidase superfamily)
VTEEQALSDRITDLENAWGTWSRRWSTAMILARIAMVCTEDEYTEILKQAVELLENRKKSSSPETSIGGAM